MRAQTLPVSVPDVALGSRARRGAIRPFSCTVTDQDQGLSLERPTVSTWLPRPLGKGRHDLLPCDFLPAGS